MYERKPIKRPLRNQDLRAAIEGAGLRYWWVAEELGIAHGTLSNWLRRELLPEDRQRILAAIQRLADRKGAQAPEPSRREVAQEARAPLPGQGG